MRYKCWRSRDNLLHVMCLDGQFEELPQRIRSLGPWNGSLEGAVEDLRLHYRLLLAEQRFVIFYTRPTLLKPERHMLYR